MKTKTAPEKLGRRQLMATLARTTVDRLGDGVALVHATAKAAAAGEHLAPEAVGALLLEVGVSIEEFDRLAGEYEKRNALAKLAAEGPILQAELLTIEGEVARLAAEHAKALADYKAKMDSLAARQRELSARLARARTAEGDLAARLPTLSPSVRQAEAANAARRLQLRELDEVLADELLNHPATAQTRVVIAKATLEKAKRDARGWPEKSAANYRALDSLPHLERKLREAEEALEAIHSRRRAIKGELAALEKESAEIISQKVSA